MYNLLLVLTALLALANAGAPPCCFVSPGNRIVEDNNVEEHVKECVVKGWKEICFLMWPGSYSLKTLIKDVPDGIDMVFSGNLALGLPDAFLPGGPSDAVHLDTEGVDLSNPHIKILLPADIEAMSASEMGDSE